MHIFIRYKLPVAFIPFFGIQISISQVEQIPIVSNDVVQSRCSCNFSSNSPPISAIAANVSYVAPHSCSSSARPVRINETFFHARFLPSAEGFAAVQGPPAPLDNASIVNNNTFSKVRAHTCPAYNTARPVLLRQPVSR